MSYIKAGGTCVGTPSLIFAPTVAGGGKPFTQVFTVMGLNGYSRPPWGAFGPR